MVFAKSACANSVSGIYGLVVEAWGQGFIVGGILILLSMTISSMKQGVLLHKLIIAELCLACLHGTFIFVDGSAAGWYTSATAVLLYISYNLHNFINWIKVKPFLGKWGSGIYFGTMVAVWPYWIAEMYFNFAYNNNLGNEIFISTRPWEALCREPWWLFTTGYLVFTIKRSYSCSILQLIRTSTRFGILLTAMGLSLAFIITDVVTVIVLDSPCAGQNPFWKIALILKCLADAIFLDDFKLVLDRLSARANDQWVADETATQAFTPSPSVAIDRPLHSHNPSAAEKHSSQHIESSPVKRTGTNDSTAKNWFDTIDC